MRYDSKPAATLIDSFLYQSIEDLPEEEATCELDCRKVQCTEREWINCRWRLRRSADSTTRNMHFASSTCA